MLWRLEKYKSRHYDSSSFFLFIKDYDFHAVAFTPWQIYILQSTVQLRAYVGREIDTYITLGVSTSQWAWGRIPLIWWLSTWPQHGLNPDYDYYKGNSLYSFLTPQHQMLLSSQGCPKPCIGNTYICSSVLFFTQIWSSIIICWFQNLYLF